MTEAITSGTEKGRTQAERQYQELVHQLAKTLTHYNLQIEPLTGSSIRLQRFIINNKDCKVLISKSTHSPKGTSQEYAYFKVPKFRESDMPDFVILLVADDFYILPTKVLISSQLSRINIPVPPLSPHSGDRNKPTIVWDDYKNEKGVTLLRQLNLKKVEEVA